MCSDKEIIVLSNRICELKYNRPKNCLDCKNFQKCEQKYKRRYEQMKLRVEKANKFKGYINSLDFQKQFRS